MPYGVCPGVGYFDSRVGYGPDVRRLGGSCSDSSQDGIRAIVEHHTSSIDGRISKIPLVRNDDVSRHSATRERQVGASGNGMVYLLLVGRRHDTCRGGGSGGNSK